VTCTTQGCTRRPRPALVICDSCLDAILSSAAEIRARREPVWVQRAKANRLPCKDMTAA
jgi:hypothetical protein